MTIQPVRPITAVADPGPDRTPDFLQAFTDGETGQPTPAPPSAAGAEPNDAPSVDATPTENSPEEDAALVPQVPPPMMPKPIAPGLRIGLQSGLRPGV